MAIGVTIFVIATLIVAIWVVIELKRFRHKIFAIFLIVLVLLTYISMNAVFKNREVDLGSFPGIVDAGKIYFSWLGGVFSNMKTITANVIHTNWKGNLTENPAENVTE